MKYGRHVNHQLNKATITSCINLQIKTSALSDKKKSLQI